MTFTPDPDKFQQLRRAPYTAIKVPYTGPFDCTAWAGAWVHNADREGTDRITGAQVRKHSDEAKPDKNSPGLNLEQIDAAIIELSNGKVDLDVHRGMDIAAAQRKSDDGRWFVLQVQRGTLVNAGYGGGATFRGPHAITVHTSNGRPVIGDPLVDHYMRASWLPIWHAAGNLWTGSGYLGFGNANCAFSRDITPDWVCAIPAHHELSRYVTDGTGKVVMQTVRVELEHPLRDLCSPPYYVHRPKQDPFKVVKITAGRKAGWVVRVKWADQVQP